jgi:diacylglycerol kinase
MKDFFISRVHSLKHALAGMEYVLRTQKNAHIHMAATISVVMMALWLNISAIPFAILILTIGTVWTAEFINTSLEAVVDLASPQRHPLAKVGKDVGAAAVLIAAISSVVIGIIILGPALLSKLGI